ncbi:hypothetical protein TrVGV298_011169 [Trichoderma virens]|nr:hypothetical protein TrVGV298_011169 [Trichoderma virens]
MASVYQNAYLVISASKSSGSEDSLFGEIDEQLKPSIIPVPSPGQGSAKTHPMAPQSESSGINVRRHGELRRGRGQQYEAKFGSLM